MGKILTVSVAAYNVESFLGFTLESCIENKILDDMEVLVIDDGSNDRTADIAQKYVNLYPAFFKLIRKENGGYGSTVNCGVQYACGKYFRLLDGDDWFISKNLVTFISYLKRTEADMVITPYLECWENNKETILKSPGELRENEVYEMDKMEKWPQIAMHNLTVKTELFQKNHILLTEKCYYTDIEYYMYPFKYARTCIFLNIPLYCYRLGREGQSMSDRGLKQHIDDHIKVLEDIIKFYYRNGEMSYGNRDIFIKERIYTLIRACLNVVWKLDSEYDAKRKMIKIDMILKQTYPYPIPYMGKEVWLIRETGYLLFPLFWLIFHNKR